MPWVSLQCVTMTLIFLVIPTFFLSRAISSVLRFLISRCDELFIFEVLFHFNIQRENEYRMAKVHVLILLLLISLISKYQLITCISLH